VTDNKLQQIRAKLSDSQLSKFANFVMLHLALRAA